MSNGINQWATNNNAAFGIPLESALPPNPQVGGQELTWDAAQQLMVWTPNPTTALVNVRALATGDGETDDTEAAQIVHDETAGFVHYPIGVYLMSEGLEITSYAAGIIGEGKSGSRTLGGTVLATDSTTLPLVAVNNADHFTLRDCGLVGTYVAGNPAASTPALLTIGGGTYGADLSNLDMSGGAVAIQLFDSFYTRINRLATRNFSGLAVVLAGPSVAVDEQPAAAEFVQCSISPGGSNKTTDCYLHKGAGSSMKFVECSMLFGRRGISIEVNSGSYGGFFYFVGGGMENQEGENFYIEACTHFMISGPSYFSNDGDANNLYFGTNTNDVTIGSVYLRGAGRTAFYFNGTNLTLAGAGIYNFGRYSAPSRGSHVILSSSASVGGEIMIVANIENNGTNIRQQPFKTNEWVLIQGNSSGLNGEYAITAVSDTQFILKGTTYAGPYTATGYARVICAGIHIGPDADAVQLSPAFVGHAQDGSYNSDYALIVDSSKKIKWALDGTWQPGQLGTIKYTPTVPPEDVYEWKGSWQIISMKFPGAISNGYVFERLPPGVYAIVGFDAYIASGSCKVRCAMEFTAGGEDESSAGDDLTAGVPLHKRLVNPLLVRIDELHIRIGVHIQEAVAAYDLDFLPIYVRLA